MNEKKQIEEMAKVIKSSLDGLGCGSFNFTGEEISTMFAKALYNAEFRKQSEGRWIEESSLYVHCSICRTREYPREHNFRSKFCPECGAKMKGGAE